MDLRDRDLYTNYRMSFVHRHEQVVDLLKKAQARGELKPINDSEELARHLEMIIHGAGHVWAMTQEGPIEQYIEHHVNYALAPYRKNGLKHKPKA